MNPVAGARRPFLFLLELGALAALTVADLLGWVPLSRTPFLVLLGWLSLRLRGLGWRDAGLARPPRLARALALGAAAGVALELFALGVTVPLFARLTGAPPDVSDFGELVGNLPLLVFFLALNWVLAAFGEEVAFRGYLLNRVAGVLGEGRAAWVVALAGVSVFFGVGHGYQGVAGIAQEALAGLWLGLLFLAAGRNLVIPIVAHGVSNTIALVLIYLNRYPGLG